MPINLKIKTITIGNQKVGVGQSVYLVAEIGINHNGSLDIAKRLIDAAVVAGCDAVKFQKRTPDLCVPENQKNKIRQTPWGKISYIDYRHRVEFGLKEYQKIDYYCKKKKIAWFASCWDKLSIDFIEQFSPPCYKIPSALLTDVDLLKFYKKTKRPLILSTGMSTMKQIKNAVQILGTKNLVIAHSTSTYPCPPEELNLNVIKTLAKEFMVPVGYSGHETGHLATIAAVALGASYIERHVTLDKNMWGTDQAASVGPEELVQLVNDIRMIRIAMGDGKKRVYESEKIAMQKLRIKAKIK